MVEHIHRGSLIIFFLCVFVFLQVVNEGAEGKKYGFNPLALKLGSSSRNLEKNWSNLILVGGDYRSNGTGKVSYMGDYYDVNRCYFILITEKYRIKGILVSFYFEDKENRDDNIAFIIEMIEDFDENDKAEKIEKNDYIAQRTFYLHENYFYAIHLYRRKTHLDWSVLVTKNDIGMLDA